jgi:hypothetical protein
MLRMLNKVLISAMLLIHRKKDPTEIAQMISRLDREGDTYESKRNSQNQQLQSLVKALAALRATKYTDPAAVQISPQLSAILKQDAITDAMLKPFTAELEKLSGAAKSIQTVPLAIAGLTDPTLRPLLPSQLRSRRPVFCDVDDFNEIIKRIKAADENSKSDAQDSRACVEFAQNPPKPETDRLSAISELERVATELRQSIEETDKTITSIIENKAKWANQLHNSVDISSNLLTYTIPLLGLVVILLMGIPILYSKATQANIIASGFILEVFTVFLLISATLVLGVAQRIPSEALGTLLGGISGFVLGRSSVNQNRSGQTGQEVMHRSPTLPPETPEAHQSL